MSAVPAVRRHDPHRRDRLVDVTIEVIAAHGLAGLTSRRIAAAADVPLGSVTYHFDGLDDLVRTAFTRHAEQMARVFRAHFAEVTDRTSMLEAAVEFVLLGHRASEHQWAVAYELYLAALRDPALREVTESWMRSSRDTLQRVLPPGLARSLDGVMEGLTMQALLTTDPPTREETRAVLARVLEVTP